MTYEQGLNFVAYLVSGVFEHSDQDSHHISFGRELSHFSYTPMSRDLDNVQCSCIFLLMPADDLWTWTHVSYPSKSH